MALTKAETIDAYLIGPKTDVVMIGGASILVCLAYWMFVAADAPTAGISLLAYYLTFIVNSPHFASSYQLLYSDYGHLIFKKKSFFWAAVIAPAIIIFAVVYGIQTSNRDVLAFLAQSMYLSVGWHYVKQIYGVSLVASTVQKRFFGLWERNIILLNLYSVWFMSWVSTNIDLNKDSLDGISYYTLGLPKYMMTVAYTATVITLVAAVIVMIKKYIKTGVRPAYSSLVGFAAIYFWYLPALHHPGFFYFIPFFHSLQYLLFVFTMKRNEVESTLVGVKDEVSQREFFLNKLVGFLALSFILGLLGFELVPKNLDRYSPVGGPLNNPTMWYFGIVLFINLHHYFIDNVIWRGDNEAVKRNLIQASQKRVQAWG